MQVRRLDMTNPAEAKSARQVVSIAFRTAEPYREYVQAAEAAEKAGQPIPDTLAEDPPYAIWGAFQDGELIAVADCIDYQMRFEGRAVPMCGIAGVGTLPEYRRLGAVKEIMGILLRHSRSRGQIFSYLFPFSFAFYGRFGYGHGCRRLRVDVPISAFRALKETGKVKRYEAADLPAVQVIYGQYVEKVNGAVVRSEGIWRSMLDKDPYLDQSLTYIWYDDQNRPGAYMTYEARRDQTGDQFRIIDWACVSMPALSGLFAFINRFADQYALVNLNVPMHIDLTTLFPEPYPFKRQMESTGQIRVVDVAGALALLRRPCCPAGSDDPGLRLWVDDDFLPENSGLYTLDLRQPQPAVSFLPAASCGGGQAGQADLRLTARILGTLLLGSNSLDDLREQADVRINPTAPPESLALLDSLFSGRKAAIFDFF